MPARTAHREEPSANPWIVAGILAATTLIYSAVLRAGFLEFDDPDNVLDNYSIRAFNLANLRHFFTTPLQFMYTPLVSLSYAVDYHLGKLDPTGYHATNLVLHLCNVVLVFLLCRALTRRLFTAYFVTIAFAIHPANVDAVAWISTRSTLLATAFSLGTLLAYLRYTRRGRLPYLLLSVLLFVLAVLSKSTAVAIVVCLPVLDWCRGRRGLSGRRARPPGEPDTDSRADRWRLVLEKLPFAAIALAGGLLTLHFRIDTDALYRYNVFDRVIVACSAVVAYLIRLLVPYPLAFAYAYPPKHGAFLPWYLYLSPLVLCAVVFLLYRTKISRKLLLFGLVFFASNIALSQSVLLVDNYKSSRYTYLPYLGLFLILAALVRRLTQPDRRAQPHADRRTQSHPRRPAQPPAGQLARPHVGRLGQSRAGWLVRVRAGWLAHAGQVWPALLVVVALAFTIITVNRTIMWIQPVRVLDNSIKHEPDVPFVYNSRGMTEYKAGDYPAALRDFAQTIRLDSRFTLAYYYRGVIKSAQGDYSGAVTDLDTVIALTPDFPYGYNERGKAELALKEYDKALADLSEAVASDSYFVDAYLHRGEVYAALGRYPEAIADYDRAVDLYPDYPDTYNYRGLARMSTGDLSGAVSDFDTAIRLSPRYAAAYFNRGDAQLAMHNIAAACTDWRTAQSYGYTDAIPSIDASCSS